MKLTLLALSASASVSSAFFVQAPKTQPTSLHLSSSNDYLGNLKQSSAMNGNAEPGIDSDETRVVRVDICSIQA